MNKFADKQLIVFDLDGTLTESKSNLRADMSRMLAKLLAQKRVAVIGGGSYAQFKQQFIAHLHCPKPLLENLFLFPTTATAFYRYRKNGWRKVYHLKLSGAEWKSIQKAFTQTFKEIHYIQPPKTYGKILENRGSQATFSALGQDVVAKLGKKGIALKEEWRRKNTPVKIKIAKFVQKQLPKFEVRTSAYTSIDVTRKGVDKAYGIRKIKKVLKISIKNMVFVGDGLYPGGNDYAAKKSGIDCIAVRGPKDTNRLIEKMIAK